MSKGIIRVTPRANNGYGSLEITEPGENDHNINVGDTLSFEDPRVDVKEEQMVECEILSPDKCNLINLK